MSTVPPSCPFIYSSVLFSILFLLFLEFVAVFYLRSRYLLKIVCITHSPVIVKDKSLRISLRHKTLETGLYLERLIAGLVLAPPRSTLP